jgi:hypothetical protein
MRAADRVATMDDVSVAAYLSDLDRALTGNPRLRRDLLREAADHLDDATDAYLRAGYAAADAEARAVADFGSVDEVAPGYQTTLAVGSARRTALLLLGVLAAQPFLWDGGLDIAAASHAQAPDNWVYATLDGVVEIGGFVGLLGAVAIVVLTAIGQRWLPLGRRAARIAGWYALATAVAVQLVGVGMVAMTQSLDLRLVVLAIALMVAPLCGVGVSARRTLATC